MTNKWSLYLNSGTEFLVHDTISFYQKWFLMRWLSFPHACGAHVFSSLSYKHEVLFQFRDSTVTLLSKLLFFSFLQLFWTLLATDLDRRQWRTCRKIAGTLLTVQRIPKTARTWRRVCTLLPMVQRALQPQVTVTLSFGTYILSLNFCFVMLSSS